MTPPGKRCSRCRAWKPLTAFHRDASKRDGLTYRCADCRNAARRKPWVPARCGRSRTTCPAGAGPAAPSWPPAGFEQLPPAGFEQLPPAAAGASASPATTPSRTAAAGPPAPPPAPPAWSHWAACALLFAPIRSLGSGCRVVNA